MPKTNVHVSASRMLPPDIRRGSNDARSGARRYYEGLDVEEHGHALAIPHVKHMPREQMLLKEKRDMQIYLELMDDDLLHDENGVESVGLLVNSNTDLALAPTLAPDIMKTFRTLVSLLKSPDTGLRANVILYPVYSRNVIFVASAIVALATFGAALGSVDVASKYTFVTETVYGDEGVAHRTDSGAYKHFV